MSGSGLHFNGFSSPQNSNNAIQINFFDIVKNSVKRYFTILILLQILFLTCLVLLSSDTPYTGLTSSFLYNLPQVNGIAVLPEGNYKLNENIQTNLSLSIEGNVKIDLNGKSMAFTSTTLPSLNINSGELTISDSDAGGTISSNCESVLISSGEFTLESGTIIVNSMTSCIFISEGSVMNMTGGTVVSSVAPAIINYGVFNKSDGIVLADSKEEGAIENHGSTNDSTPDRGEINIELNATYPTVNYSITLPVIDSLSLQRTENSNLSEKEFDIVINDVENLFDERFISVSFVTDGVMSNEKGNILPFNFEIDGKTPDETGEVKLIIDQISGVETFSGRLLIDTKDIPARGTYTTDITYMIEVNEVSEE